MRVKPLFAALLGVSLSFAALAQQAGPAAAPAASPAALTVKADAPKEYTVAKGDTLWDIAGKFLTQPWLWPEIWDANPQVADANLIFPGDVLKLEYVDGKPRVRSTRGAGGRAVKLSPTVRATPHDQAVPTIPLAVLNAFLLRMKVVDEAEMAKAPYIVSSFGDRLMAANGDRVYVRGARQEDGERYQVYKLGTPLKDPDTQEVLAHEGIYVAEAAVQSFGDPSTMLLSQAQREASSGDRLLPVRAADQGYSNFQPHASKRGLEARVLTILDGVQQFGRYQSVVINRGKRDGMERGHVLAVMGKGETVKDKFIPRPEYFDKVEDKYAFEKAIEVKMPNERAGTLMVIEAFEKVSYALVMDSAYPMRVGDTARTP